LLNAVNADIAGSAGNARTNSLVIALGDGFV
jgi:hypothetical protein